MLESTEEIWANYKGGEIGKKRISQHHITESACSVVQFAVFNEASINNFVFLLTVLTNPSSVTSVLASIRYAILQSTTIKALKALPLHIKRHHRDWLWTCYYESWGRKYNSKKGFHWQGLECNRMVYHDRFFSHTISQYWNQCLLEIKRSTLF